MFLWRDKSHLPPRIFHFISPHTVFPLLPQPFHFFLFSGDGLVDLEAWQGLDVNARAFGSDGSPVTLYGNVSTLVDGVVEFQNLTINWINSNYTIEFELEGGQWTVNSTLFDVIHGPPRKLQFVMEPNQGVALGGEVLAVQPVVRLVDNANNIVPQEDIDYYNYKVVLELEDPFGCGGSLTGGDDTQSIENSMATFADLAINKICYLMNDEGQQEGYRFKAYIYELPDVIQYSEYFQVLPGHPSRLNIIQPTSDMSFTSMEIFQVEVTAFDNGGNTVTLSNSPVNISIVSPQDSGATLMGDLSVVPVDGVATFNVQIDKAGRDYILQVKSSIVNKNTPKIHITHADYAGIEFSDILSQYPIGEVMGDHVGGSVAVHLVDSSGNTAELEAPREVNLSLLVWNGTDFHQDNDLLSGTLSVNTTDGVGLFGDLRVLLLGYFRLLAQSTLLGETITTTSTPFSVVIGVSVSLRYIVPPPVRELENYAWLTSTIADGTLRGPPVVDIRDSQGNLVDTLSTPSTNISYTIGDEVRYYLDWNLDVRHCLLEVDNSGVVLEGTLRVPIVKGVCTWEYVLSRGRYSSVVIKASLVGIDQFGVPFDERAVVRSDPYYSGLGEFSQLSFTTQPSGGVVDKSWSQFPVVRTQDRAGNTYEGPDREVFLSLLLVQRAGSSVIVSGPEIPLEYTRMNGVGGVYNYESRRGEVVNVVSGQVVNFTWNEPGVYRLVARDANSDILTYSELFDIVLADITLRFRQQPGGGVANELWTRQPEVALMDPFGNVKNYDNSTIVRISLKNTRGASNPSRSVELYGGGAEIPETTKILSQGVAQFELSMDAAGTGFTLLAEQVNDIQIVLSSVESEPFNIEPNVPHSIRIQSQPQGGPGTRAVYSKLPSQPHIAMLDRVDNVVTYIDDIATASLSLYSVPDRTLFPELESETDTSVMRFNGEEEAGEREEQEREVENEERRENDIDRAVRFRPLLLVGNNTLESDPRDIKILGETNIPFVRGWGNFTDIALQWAFDGVGSGWRFLITTEENVGAGPIDNGERGPLQLNFSIITDEFNMSAPLPPTVAYIDVPKTLQEVGEQVVTANTIISSLVVIISFVVLTVSAASSGSVMAAGSTTTTSSARSAWQLIFNYIIYLQMFIVGVQHNDKFEDAWPLFSSMRVFQGNIASENSVSSWAAWSHCLAIKGITFLCLTVVSLVFSGYYVQTCCSSFFIYGNFFLPLYLILFSPLLESILESPGEDLWFVSLTLACIVIFLMFQVVSTTVVWSFNSSQNKRWRWVLPDEGVNDFVKPPKGNKGDKDKKSKKRRRKGDEEEEEDSVWSRINATWGCRFNLYGPRSEMRESIKQIEEVDWKEQGMIAEAERIITKENYLEMKRSKQIWETYYWRPLFEQVVWYDPEDGILTCIDYLRVSVSHYFQFIKFLFLTVWVCAAVLLDGTTQNFFLIGISCFHMFWLLLLAPYQRPFMHLEMLFGFALACQQLFIYIILDNPNRIWALYSMIVVLVMVFILGIAIVLYFKPPGERDDIQEFIQKHKEVKGTRIEGGHGKNTGKHKGQLTSSQHDLNNPSSLEMVSPSRRRHDSFEVKEHDVDFMLEEEQKYDDYDSKSFNDPNDPYPDDFYPEMYPEQLSHPDLNP